MKRWANVCGVDLEGTARTAGGVILSVGIAFVSRHDICYRLFKMPGISLPMDVTGQYLMTEEGKYNEHHGEIRTYGDFDKHTWNWAVKTPEMAHTIWDQIDWKSVNCPHHVRARLRGNKWNEIRRWLDKVAIETYAMGGMVRLGSDNQEFDFGRSEAELNLFCQRAYDEPYGLNFLPTTYSHRRRFNIVAPVGAYRVQRRAGVLQHFDDYDPPLPLPPVVPHRADSDALGVALTYAGYLAAFPETDNVCSF
jgi:hypothetical protein